MPIPVGGNHDEMIIYQGAGFREEFEVFEDDETTPIPFPVGTTGIAQLRTSERSESTLLADFTVDIDDNKLIISLTAEETRFNIPETLHVKAHYDIFVTEPDQEPIMFVQGEISIDPNVTVPPVPPVP
jgi:hypothetical protein